jgi:hypothetical protein
MSGWQPDPRYQQPQQPYRGPVPPPQPYPQQWQQPQPAPRMTVTKKPITFAEHVFHFLMCFPTCGLWAFVWIARAAGKRKEKTYYR